MKRAEQVSGKMNSIKSDEVIQDEKEGKEILGILEICTGMILICQSMELKQMLQMVNDYCLRFYHFNLTSSMSIISIRMCKLGFIFKNDILFNYF